MFTKAVAKNTSLFVGAPLLLLSVAWAFQAKAGQKGIPTGQQVYRQRCASCHGINGEGGKGYSRPLTGNNSIIELGRYIAQSMPPGPRKCPAPEAKKVAGYIYNAFYSPLAQARNKPARVVLSRLTVRQFRNAVADLLGSFHEAIPQEERRGLHGEYFKAGRFNANNRVLERTDSTVQFDFGTDGPVPGKFDPHHFSALWQGSVLAPDTGEYEFVVRTEHAVQLWVNGGTKPLIDAWVKSGNDNEYHGIITLLGGRTYPLRLEFTKSTQGVDDSEKKKGKPAPKASIALLWKRPKQALEVIPERNLLPVSVPETFVIATPFPPDDRSIGYERGTSISKAWDEATTSAALETATYLSSHLPQIAGVPADAKDRKARLQTFCRQFVETAFRRPITPEIERLYIQKQFEAVADPEIAVKRVALLALKSPRFLYREVGSQQSDNYDTASRLSFGLWDSLPDRELRRAAAAGELSSREQVERQAERMQNDPRAWNKLREFLLAWLKVDQAPELAKNTKKIPEFDASVASDLRTSLELFLEKTAWNGKADYRDLMLSNTVFLNGRLAKIYNANMAPDAPFQPVSCAPTDRSGVLTQPYLLSTFAYLDTSSPIHRGVLIIRNMLGRTLQPPPAAFAPLSPDLHPNMTTRQRIAMQTKPSPCNSCHNRINPLGYTLERYDAIGRLRDKENGQQIDATGTYLSIKGELVRFSGAQDLARYLANSEEAHAAFVEKLFHHLVKQPVRAYGTQTLPALELAFTEKQYNIRKLMTEIMTATALPQSAASRLPIRVGGIP